MISTSQNHDFADYVKDKYTTIHLLKNGVNVVFRPIEPKDQSKLKNFVESLSKESMHMRFFEEMKELPEETLRKLANLDYHIEVALIAEPQGDDKLIAVARLVLTDDMRRGEFAIVVADAWQGLGLGLELTEYTIGIARDYGLEEVYMFISSDNERMIALGEKTGFKIRSVDSEVVTMNIHFQ